MSAGTQMNDDSKKIRMNGPNKEISINSPFDIAYNSLHDWFTENGNERHTLGLSSDINPGNIASLLRSNSNS